MIALQISNFFKDYSDYIVLIPSVILGGIVAYWIYLKQKQIKQLSFEILANSNIVSIKKEFKDSIEIKYNGNEVQKLWLTIVKFTNTGNTAIAKSDFEEGIKLNTNKSDELLSYETENVNPSNLNIGINQIKTGLEVEPCLINSGDTFSVKLLSSGGDLNLNINSRIAGIKKLTSKSSTNNSSKLSKSILKSSWVMIMTSMFGVLVSVGSFYTSLFVKPKIELLNNTIHQTGNNEIQDLKLISTNKSGEKYNIIFYKINDDDELNRSIVENGIWTIDLKHKRNFILEGKNEICYKLKIDSKEYNCLNFSLQKNENENSR